MTHVPEAEQPVGPVFVDPSGRRARRVQKACWVLSAVMVGYIALVLVSLVAPAGSLNVPGLGPLLPGPAAGPLVDPAGRLRKPGQVLVPSPTGSPTASGSTNPGTSTSTGSSSTPGPVSGTPVASAVARPTSLTTARPTVQPTPATTSAGQASAHPTPRSTNAHQPP